MALYANGRAPASALVVYRGCVASPDMASRVAWVENEYMRQNPGGYITPNEIYRDYDTQVYWKNQERLGNTPSAATPGYSNHGDWDIGAVDWNADNIALRDQIAARVGLVRTVPSESWHYAVRTASSVDTAGSGNYTSIGNEGDMPLTDADMARIETAIRDQTQPKFENLRVEIASRIDNAVRPALADIQGWVKSGYGLPKVYQINQPGSPRHSYAAAIDIDEGYVRGYGSAADLANDQRLQIVAAGTPIQVSEAAFNDLQAKATARLKVLQTKV